MALNKTLLFLSFLFLLSCLGQSEDEESMEIKLTTKVLRYPNPNQDVYQDYKNQLEFIIRNNSDKTFFFVLDSSGISLNKRGTLKEEPHPYKAFRPLMIIKDSLNNALTTSEGFFQPDFENETELNEWNQRFIRLEDLNDKAKRNFGHLNENEFDLRNLYCQYADDYGIVLQPKDSITRIIDVALPSNDDGLGSFLELVMITPHDGYSAHIEMNGSKELLQTMLSEEQLNKLKEQGIIIWDGHLVSNVIPLVYK